jgi:hypothetical protein
MRNTRGLLTPGGYVDLRARDLQQDAEVIQLRDDAVAVNSWCQKPSGMRMLGNYNHEFCYREVPSAEMAHHNPTRPNPLRTHNNLFNEGIAENMIWLFDVRIRETQRTPNGLRSAIPEDLET